MTTIAFAEGTIAADSQMTSGGAKLRIKKLHRLSDGSLFAGSGEVALISRMLKWAEAGFPEKPRPRITEDSEIECIVVRPNGAIWLVDDKLEPLEIDEPFAAIGSGFAYALGAMACGKSAVEAVEIAARFDADTSAPLHTMELQEKK